MGDRQGSQGWLMLAVGSLVLAGTLSIILVIGRLPVLNEWINDPLFARRCLVIHVNLALGVWLYSFLASLFLALPAQSSGKGGQRSVLLGLLGVLLFVSCGAITGVRPVLSNYIPALDHPLFVVGLVVFGIAVIGTFMKWERWIESSGDSGFLKLPAATRVGLRASAFAFLLAMFTFMGAWWTTPTSMSAGSYYELVFWGGGHVLQVASVAAMLSVWVLLLDRVLGFSPLSHRWARVLFGLLLAPACVAPWWAWQGTTTATYYPRFTILMRWGIFPIASLILLACLLAIFRGLRAGNRKKESLKAPYLWGFLASASLTVLGFVLGAMIRSSSTLIPAHYHAAIGAVTVSFMTVTYLLCQEFRWDWSSARMKRLARWQPVVFGVGQVVFALGFGYAKMARKIYGREQNIRSTSEQVGMWFMGLGGLVAVVGGLLFLSLVIVAWRRRKPVLPLLDSWERNDESVKEVSTGRTGQGGGGAGYVSGAPGSRGASLAKAHGQSMASPLSGCCDSSPIVHSVGSD